MRVKRLATPVSRDVRGEDKNADVDKITAEKEKKARDEKCGCPENSKIGPLLFWAA
jgi:hypothetical protein